MFRKNLTYHIIGNEEIFETEVFKIGFETEVFETEVFKIAILNTSVSNISSFQLIIVLKKGRYNSMLKI